MPSKSRSMLNGCVDIVTLFNGTSSRRSGASALGPDAASVSSSAIRVSDVVFRSLFRARSVRVAMEPVQFRRQACGSCGARAAHCCLAGGASALPERRPDIARHWNYAVKAALASAHLGARLCARCQPSRRSSRQVVDLVPALGSPVRSAISMRQRRRIEKGRYPAALRLLQPLAEARRSRRAQSLLA